MLCVCGLLRSPPVVSCTTGYGGTGERFGTIQIVRFPLSQLKRWLLTRRRGLRSARDALQQCAGVGHPPHRPARAAGPTNRTPDRFRSSERCSRQERKTEEL